MDVHSRRRDGGGEERSLGAQDQRPRGRNPHPDGRHPSVPGMMRRERKGFKNASKVFAEVVAGHANLNTLEGIADTHQSHPIDSHLLLRVQLGSLKVDVTAVSDASLAVSPLDPAINHIVGLEQKEEEISEMYQMILAKQLGIDLGFDSESSGT